MDAILINNAEELFNVIKNLVGEDQEFEVCIRGINQQFKQFQKFVLHEAKEKKIQPEKMNMLINGLFEVNNNLGNIDCKLEQLAAQCGNIGNLAKLTVLLEGANLCVSIAGFMIMNAKLNKLSLQISKVLETVKEQEGMHEIYKFDTVCSEYSDMLDSIRKKRTYSEKEYRQLIDLEFNVLKLLITGFERNVVTRKEDILFAILSLSSMLATTLCYFDELYYFEYKDVLSEDECWHMSHDTWTGVYDLMHSPKFIAEIQDLAFLDNDLNQQETELFVASIMQAVNDNKLMIKNNQLLIKIADEKEKYNKLQQLINQGAALEVENAKHSKEISNNVQLHTICEGNQKKLGLMLN